MEACIDRIINFYKAQLNIDERQCEILKYAIRIVISTVLGYTLILVLAWLLDIFYLVLVIAITVSIYRSASGGAHCSNVINCGLYSAITANILGMIANLFNPTSATMLTFMIIIFLFSIWTINKYAPADTPGKPISSKIKREKLRTYSFMIVSLWCTGSIFWYSSGRNLNVFVYGSTVGILWQSFTVTDWGYRFCHLIDKGLSQIIIRRG